MEEDEDSEEDEASAKQTPKKGRKGANKPDEMDEVDKALAELDIKYVLHPQMNQRHAYLRYGTSTADQTKAPTAGPSESKGFMAFR